MISEYLSLNRESVWMIVLNNLGMQKVCAKMMPKILLRRPKADSSQKFLRHPREGKFVPSLEKLKGTWLLMTFDFFLRLKAAKKENHF